ncbi:hypothetical protein ACE6H2_007379 [Prunus campanulata]
MRDKEVHKLVSGGVWCSYIVGLANLTAWCSGPRGYASTHDVLLLDAVRFVRGHASTVYRRLVVVFLVDLRWCSGASLGGNGRMIYGMNEKVTEMVFRRLENQGSKSSRGVIEAKNLRGGARSEQVGSPIDIWDREPWWCDPINPGKSRPLP